MQKQADADLSTFWFIDPAQRPEVSFQTDARFLFFKSWKSDFKCCCDCQYTNRFWYNSIEHQCQEFGDFYCMKCQETLVTDQIPSNTEEISFPCWDPSLGCPNFIDNFSKFSSTFPHPYKVKPRSIWMILEIIAIQQLLDNVSQRHSLTICLISLIATMVEVFLTEVLLVLSVVAVLKQARASDIRLI